MEEAESLVGAKTDDPEDPTTLYGQKTERHMAMDLTDARILAQHGDL